jgi:tetratricopeptide (TPR) repeat protein
MNYSRIFPVIFIAGLCLMTESAQATDEDAFLGQIQPPSGQTMGHGRSTVWTLPLVATQYQPLQPTPAMQAALQAQHDGRFLDALILLDDAGKIAQANAETKTEINLLRSSFLLQGYQSRQAVEILVPLLAKTQHAADAYALTAMARLQQGKMQEALEAAQHAHDLGGGVLPHMALSYALQGTGRLAEARDVMRDVNTLTPHSAVTLAREAELALTLNQNQAARSLVDQAHEVDAMHPYVIAVSGLVYLIDGNAREAKTAFETALQRDPKDAKALFGLGLAEIKLGDFQAGQKKLQAANEADPGNALILTYLGRSQQQSGQTEAAKASWRSAQQADPKDPIPWLYQAQAELQANDPLEARENLRQAQARAAYRSVYRGDRLLKEDEQLLRANLAETQRLLGLDGLAFQTLSDSVSEKNSANLRNQADVLQGQRFGESARRSLLLQSQFNARPGTLPADLDIYGDGAGQTGASTPQHGVVSGLSAQQASYNNYDELFNRNATLEASVTTGNQSTKGEQILLGVGSDTLGLGIAQRHFITDGNAPFENLDNLIWQGIMQWQPTQSTQAFVLRQSFDSRWGATFFPADPLNSGTYAMIHDNSQVTRIGVRHTLADDSELRGLWSRQRTEQTNESEYICNTQPFINMPPWFCSESPFPQFTQYGNSNMHSAELQYRSSGAGYAAQWGVQQNSGQILFWDASDIIFRNSTQYTQQYYVDWQQTLNPHWQLDAGLGWGKIDNRDNTGGGNSTYLARWLPKLGVVYSPDTVTHLRLAAWQGMGVPGTGDATLAPVSLAGLILTHPSDNGRLVHAVALGWDRQLSSAWLLDGETQQRKTEQPTTTPILGQILTPQQVDESRLALHWQPDRKPLTVSLAYDYERIQNDPSGSIPLDSVFEQNLRSQQLGMSWFASAQWTINWTWSRNKVAGTQQLPDPFNSSLLILIPYQDSFTQFDANLSWKFYGPRGLLAAGVRNATDTRFQYAEIDKLNPRFINGRLVYARLKLVW